MISPPCSSPLSSQVTLALLPSSQRNFHIPVLWIMAKMSPTPPPIVSASSVLPSSFCAPALRWRPRMLPPHIPLWLAVSVMLSCRYLFTKYAPPQEIGCYSQAITTWCSARWPGLFGNPSESPGASRWTSPTVEHSSILAPDLTTQPTYEYNKETTTQSTTSELRLACLFLSPSISKTILVCTVCTAISTERSPISKTLQTAQTRVVLLMSCLTRLFFPYHFWFATCMLLVHSLLFYLYATFTQLITLLNEMCASLSLVMTSDYLRLLDMHFHITCQLLNSTVSDKYRISMYSGSKKCPNVRMFYTKQPKTQ